MTRVLPEIDKLRKDLSGTYDLLHFYTRDKTQDMISLIAVVRFMNNVSPYEWYNPLRSNVR